MARVVIRLLAILGCGGALAAGPTSPFTAPPSLVRAGAGAPGLASADSIDSAASAPAAPALTLDGLRTGSASRALIDGRWLALGEQLHGATLLSIDATGVLLRHAGGQTQRLSLLSPAVSWQRSPRLPPDARSRALPQRVTSP